MLTHPRRWLPKRIIETYDSYRFQLYRFELATTWGLLWQRRYTGTEFDYMQVGSGNNLLPGFLNTDHFVRRKAAFHLDLRHPLPFADDRWAGIFAHHCIEHLAYSKSLLFFREAHRTLRPGGTLRVVVPDAEKFVRIYGMNERERMAHFQEALPAEYRDRIQPRTALAMVNFIFYCGDNNHLCAWDHETLSIVLKESGFPVVERVSFGKSRDPRMSNIDVHADWESHSLYVEATKAK